MENQAIEGYETLVAQAGEFHGDICAGISIGTRMTMCGLKHIGIADPKGDVLQTDAIIALGLLNGSTQAQIAEQLDITPGVVSRRAHRNGLLSLVASAKISL